MGRGDTNQLILEDPFVSRRHARIEYNKDSGFFVLKDMESRNGVYLNGNRVYKAVLENNDQIQIGKGVFHFSFERDNGGRELVGQSFNKPLNLKLSRIPYIAKSEYPVLLLGPSGTGKDILARRIHSLSKVSAGPLISVNCGALTESLIESELFGHIKGSYTGASSNRKGAFIAARGGSLFLDEIGDLPLSLQPKLLRAIESREVKPVGADAPITTDARIIAATHQNLREKVQKKEFRGDLYYRLNVVSVTLPSLTDRMEDFKPLLKSFLAELRLSFSPGAIKVFENHSWPGNIRELKNTLARAKALFPDEVIGAEKARLLTEEGLEIGGKRPSGRLTAFEKKLLLVLMRQYRGNQKQIAAILNVPVSTLHDRLAMHRIHGREYKAQNEVSY